MSPHVTHVVERLRATMWVLPSVAVATSVVLGLVVSNIRVGPNGSLAWIAYDGGVEGARGLLQVVAGSMITVTSVTFSLTLVVLQMASTQYSPRLLRTFVRDLGNQVVLATFLSTFAFALVVLPSVRSPLDDRERFVPDLAVTMALLLAMASLAALVYFIHHITRSIRVEAVMLDVRVATLDSITRNCDVTWPLHGRTDVHLHESEEGSVPLRAHRSGYLQAFEPAPVLTAAAERDACVVLRRRVGEFVTEGTVLAWAWPRQNDELGETAIKALEHATADGVELGFERNLIQDIAFGVRQLVDIALKALSPSLNDPSTAVDAIGHLSAILHELALRPLGGEIVQDGDGHTRIGVPKPSFDDYLAIVCTGIAHYGGHDVVVMRRLLRMLEDLGTVVRSEERQVVVLRWIDRVMEESRVRLDTDAARATVERGAEQARRAVEGKTSATEFFIV